MPRKVITSQEEFWAGEFGDDYCDRNVGAKLIASNTALFSRILSRTAGVGTVIEFGANIGLNLQAISQLLPNAELSAIEINAKAVSRLKGLKCIKKVFHESLLKFGPEYTWDLVLVKGVLIHINPDALKGIYSKIYESSRRYILLSEYYNPRPMEVNYRGHSGKLFKRDFAGEMLDLFSDLRLLDYGFVYHRDPTFPQDDFTWFLLEKNYK